MNIKKTIEKIQASCNSYVDPELVATIITSDYYLGSNDLKEYPGDSYSDKIINILKDNDVFMSLGLLVASPLIDQCDIYSTEKETIKLSKKDFKKYELFKDEYFGILIEKESYNIKVGFCDICSCKLDSSFKEVKASKDPLYNKLLEIANRKIVNQLIFV